MTSTSRNNRVATRIAATVLATVGVALAVPSAATAVEAPSVEPLALRNGVCEAGEFCLFRDSGGTGPVIDWARGRDDLTYANDTWPIVGGPVDDRASSYLNLTNCPVRIFRNSQHNPPGLTVGAGAAGNLAGTPVGGDQASSHNACV